MEICNICNTKIEEKKYDGSFKILWISDPPVIYSYDIRKICLCNECFNKLFKTE